MGLLCAKLRDCCCYQAISCCRNSLPPIEDFQVLILGPSGSGKTELGHRLSRVPRALDDQEATNGVRCYQMSAVEPPAELQLTEVGGNAEMQRLWKHYYATSHALIYCFDLAADPIKMEGTFALLTDCLLGTQLAGKPVLLVASRHRVGVQLYDVEYAFGLEELAKSCGCPLLICHMDEAEDLQRGIRWLCHQLLARKSQLDQWIRYDVNMQAWQRRKRSLLSTGKLAQVHRHRFRRQTRKFSKGRDDEVGAGFRIQNSGFGLVARRDGDIDDCGSAASGDAGTIDCIFRQIFGTDVAAKIRKRIKRIRENSSAISHLFDGQQRGPGHEYGQDLNHGPSRPEWHKMPIRISSSQSVGPP
ncbi:uncharacterized protein Dyak_GE16719 [Drosophila yakuba]|uniref:Uncharacterized protein n=1 Tax=Drosophila yakuba TaxID=7245 RepID=B4PY81_DROYA|nr:uncharacterized protein Dyak_GE16719 [Drosophila yakuba]